MHPEAVQGNEMSPGLRLGWPYNLLSKLGDFSRWMGSWLIIPLEQQAQTRNIPGQLEHMVLLAIELWCKKQLALEGSIQPGNKMLLQVHAVHPPPCLTVPQNPAKRFSSPSSQLPEMEGHCSPPSSTCYIICRHQHKKKMQGSIFKDDLKCQNSNSRALNQK